MTFWQTVACVYVVVAVGSILGYVGFFRCHCETLLMTFARSAFVGLLWPIWSLMLIGLVLGL